MEQTQADQNNYTTEEADNSSTVQTNVNGTSNGTLSGKHTMNKKKEYEEVVVAEEREEQHTEVSNHVQQGYQSAEQLQHQMQQPPPIIMTSYGDQQPPPFYQQPLDKFDGTANTNSQLFSFGIAPLPHHPHAAHLNPNAALQQQPWNHHLNPPANNNPNNTTAVIPPMTACYPPPPGIEAQVLSPTSPVPATMPLQVPMASSMNLTATTNTTGSPASSSGHHYHPHPNHLPHPNMLMTQHHPHHDPLEIILGVFPCVHLRNLPFEANVDDVLIFFQGLVMLDVLVCCYFGNNNKPGVFRGNGEAFVIFANPIDFQMALQRDRQRMGRRYIEVNQGKRVDYYAAIASQCYRRNNYNNIDYHSKAHDNSSNMNNLHSKPSWNNSNSVSNTNTTTGSTQSDSNDNSTYQDQSSTTSSTNNANRKGKVQQQQSYRDNGNYYFNNNAGYQKSNFHNRNNQSNSYNNNNSGNVSGGTQLVDHTGYLRLRGLPYTATVQDIKYFFTNYELVESTVAFTFKSDGRATGEAYVEFVSPEESYKAMVDMHRKIMGNRYIELFVSFKEEHDRALVRFQNR